MINTPWIFNTIWYFIKGLLAVRTINKIKVLGKSYIEEINKEIDFENLPIEFGGNLIEKDRSCYKFNKSYFNSDAMLLSASIKKTLSSPQVSLSSLSTSNSITEEYLHSRLLSTYV